ncbi:MAG: preQ(1) synthase [Verrucomicrobiota bacterium]|nr:preQ(1) synthase [Verrucomicrobiota bacterium]
MNSNYIKDLTLLTKSVTVVPNEPSSKILETFENRYSSRDYTITFDCPEFTSCCPVTGQPDFGKITIHYIADKKCIESKSLKLYLFSYRNFNTFHEEAVNRILDDLVANCSPKEMEIIGKFMPRGGISINVSAKYKKPENKNE